MNSMFGPVRRAASYLGLATALLLAPVVAAQAPRPIEGTSRIGLEQNPARLVFEFHSDFWVNLHHYLYQEARLRAHESTSRGGDAAHTNPAAPSGLDSPQWRAALDYYTANLADHDLLFDGYMTGVNQRLAELEACPNLSGSGSPACASGLRPALIAALEGAAPLYRAQLWPEHDHANRLWIAGVTPLVREMGWPLSLRLTSVYRSAWPRESIRVDVVCYAGPLGGYTALEPATHITISSNDPRNQDLSGFEVLFHEASHALAATVSTSIDRECRARNKPIPRDLWHALLFYTTGEMVKRALASTGPAQPAAPPGASLDVYTPYAQRYGLYARGWENYQRLLERYWQPYLDGRVDFDHAIITMVAAL